jgi:hypothetical protein
MCKFVNQSGELCLKAKTTDYCREHAKIIILLLRTENAKLKETNEKLRMTQVKTDNEKAIIKPPHEVKIAQTQTPIQTYAEYAKTITQAHYLKMDQRLKIAVKMQIELEEKLAFMQLQCKNKNIKIQELTDQQEIANNTNMQLNIELKEYHFIQQFEFIKNDITTLFNTKDFKIIEPIMTRPSIELFNRLRTLFKTEYLWFEFNALRIMRNELVHTGYKRKMNMEPSVSELTKQQRAILSYYNII